MRTFVTLTFLATAILVAAVTAQADTLGFNANKSATPSATVSPENFKNLVNQLSSQTKSNLSQQTKDLLPKSPAKPGIAQPPVTTPPQQNPSSVSISNGPSNPTTTTTTPNQAPIATPQQQTDTYTGFGKSSTAPANTNSSGSTGLGIKY